MPQRNETKVIYNRIPELWRHVDVGVEEVLRETAKAVVEDAQSRLQPGQFGYDTGKARDSIRYILQKRQAQVVGGGDMAPWFPFNEFGTRYRAAAPALLPAFEKYADDFAVKMNRLVTGFRA
jgi:HK97 gp10 family phage protein